MYFTPSYIAFTFLVGSQLVAGHGAIVKAVGDAGGQGSAIGIDPSTPRDGTKRKPFQQDTTRFKGDAAASCGETLGGGDNDPETGTATVLQQNGGALPQVSAGGQLMMTLHQVNGDGAGPYTCMMDTTGAGTNWQQIQVTSNVPGKNGRDNDGKTTDFPLTAQMPAAMACTGTVAGQSNVCMVRCQNPANAGPFGGCVPVQQAGAGGNSTTASTGTAGTAGTASTGNTGAAAGTGNTGATAGTANTGATSGTGNTAAASGTGNTASTASSTPTDDDEDEEDEDEEEEEEDTKRWVVSNRPKRSVAGRIRF